MTNVLAVPFFVLPRRYWRRVEEDVAVGTCAFLSGFFTVCAGAAIGIPGFLAFVTEQTSIRNQTMLAAEGWIQRISGPVPKAPDFGFTISAAGLGIFVFLFFTVEGRITAYLMASGALRMIGAGFDDPLGDPLLSLIDTIGRTSVNKVRSLIRRIRRHMREGPDIGDEVFGGDEFSLDADLVLLSCRQKPGWDRGTVLFTRFGEFRIDRIFDIDRNGSLRTGYVLKRHRLLEVVRKRADYVFASSGFTDAARRAIGKE